MPDQNSALAPTIQGVFSTDLTAFLTDNVIPIRGPRSCSDLSDILGSSSNRESALDLGRRGFAVFPVRDWGDGGGWKPIKAFPERASCDQAQIKDWWRCWPEARVGLLTGERNGITVLDLDIKNGKDGIATLAKLGFPDVATIALCRSRTPTGGLHLFFTYDPRLKGTVGKIGEGIDVRNNGGYVIAPESFKNDQLYRSEGFSLSRERLAPFPESLLPAVAQAAEPVERGQASPQQIEWARIELVKRAAVLAGTTEGGRQYGLNAIALWAGGVAAHGAVERDEVYQLLKDASTQNGFPPREFESSFAHGFEDGVRKPIRLPLDISD